MASKETYAAIVTTIFERLLPIRDEIERRDFPAGLDNRITLIARDLEAILERGGDATPERRALLAQVTEELRAGRAAADANKDHEAWAAFTRAVGCIDGVCAAVTGEVPK